MTYENWAPIQDTTVSREIARESLGFAFKKTAQNLGWKESDFEVEWTEEPRSERHPSLESRYWGIMKIRFRLKDE